MKGYALFRYSLKLFVALAIIPTPLSAFGANQLLKAKPSTEQNHSIAASSRRPIVIAHRGASGYLPEHTIEAVSLAYGQKADFIEQDVVLSKDGRPMVLHDIYLDTVTDVADRFAQRRRADGRFYVIDFTLSELKTLKVKERFDPKTGERMFPGRHRGNTVNFRIPTLGEELALIKELNLTTKRKVGVYIELKKPKFHLTAGQDMLPVVLEALRQHGYSPALAKSGQRPVYLQSFDSSTVKRLRSMETGFPLIQLIAADTWGESDDNYQSMLSAEGIQKIAEYADGIGPWIGHIYKGKGEGGSRRTTNLVPTAQKAGLLVHPFTFRIDDLPEGISNHDELMELFANQLRVDGIFTDFPDQTVQWLETKLKN